MNKDDVDDNQDDDNQDDDNQDDDNQDDDNQDDVEDDVEDSEGNQDNQDDVEDDKREKIKNVEKFIRNEQDRYVNTGETEYEDEIFDTVLEYHERKTGKKLKLIGSKPPRDKIKLEYPMPSLDKITYGKNDLNELRKFMDQNPEPYIITSKVDGTSIQLIYKNGNLIISTGGDGVDGFDVTYLKDYIDFPEINKNIVIRGELTISNEDFEELVPDLREKGLKAKNSRNVVNGIVNRKEIIPELLQKCIFIAFSILSSTEDPRVQFKNLKKLGFRTPDPIILSNIEDEESFLDDLLSEHKERTNKNYRTDGIVITAYRSFYQSLENSNPSFMFAFKKNSMATTSVLDVEWNITRYGYLAPVAIIEPVEILGNTYNRASAVHAKEVQEKGIGPGALVVVELCGDSIPKISQMIEKADPKFPDCEWYWNDSGVKIIAEDFEGVDVIKMHFFLKTIGVKHCGRKTLKRMYDEGIDSIDKLIRIRVDDLLEIDRLGEKSATRFVGEIKDALDRITWPKLMAGCGIFAELIGVERCQKFIEKFPDFRTRDISKEEISEIEGFGDILAERMEQGLPEFKKWISRNKMCQPKKVKLQKREQNLRGEIIVFTGITAGDVLKEEIQSRGGIVKDNFVKKTTIVVKKNDSFTSNKVKEAEKSNIEIIVLQKFLNKYLK